MITVEKKAMTTRQINQAELDQIIADEFGVNADYVSEILKQFESNTTSVEPEWRSYCDEQLDNGHAVSKVTGQVTGGGQRGDLATPPAQSAEPASAQTTPSQNASRALQPAYDWGAQHATQ